MSKNILFIPFEVESVPLSRLAKEYEADNNISIFNVDYWTFVNNRNYYKIYDDLNLAHFYNLEEDYRDLNENPVPADLEYLGRVEKENHFKRSINELINTDSILTTAAHFRDYYNVPSREVRQRWIELFVRKCIRVLDEVKPDVIITFSNNYFGKNLLYELAQARNIQFLTVISGRIEDEYYVVDNCGVSTSEHQKNVMANIGDKHKERAEKFIESIVSKTKTTYNSHQVIVDSFNRGQWWKGFWSMAWGLTMMTYNCLFQKTYYRGRFRANYLGSVYYKAFWYTVRNYWRKHVSIKRVKFAKSIPENAKFYYFPLQVVPESSVLTLSKDYKQEAIIKDISARLPADTLLVVKEHLPMIGERPMRCYEEMRRLHNVILIDPMYSSIDLLKRCLGVISISSTVLLEAAFMGKRCICTGYPEFDHINSIELYNKYTTSFEPQEPPAENNAKEFVQSIYELGEPIDMVNLLYGKWERTETPKFKADIQKAKQMLDAYIN